MAREVIGEKSLNFILKAVNYLVQIPENHFWIDYDKEGDMLYLHFVEKPESNHSEMREDGIILDYNDDSLVGISIMEASKRSA